MDGKELVDSLLWKEAQYAAAAGGTHPAMQHNLATGIYNRMRNAILPYITAQPQAPAAPKEYVGWTCGKCGAPVAGGFSKCDKCGRDPKPGPFIELINFTDCDGAIGPLVAAKLAADFDAHAEAAKASSYPGFWRLYDDFRIAFHLAADSGAVHFH